MEHKSDLFELIRELSEADVKYVICGGVACVLHGVERATFDLDISMAFEKDNIEKIIRATKKFGLKPRIPEPVQNLFDPDKRKKWFEEKGALVYTFVSDKTPLQLDIFLNYPKTFEELLEGSENFLINGLNIKVSSIADLLLVKKLIDPLRDKDIIDIKELEKIKEQKDKPV
ncbi:MAG: hypothetical protein ABI462_15090 [Ignavibacteria bacterium]